MVIVVDIFWKARHRCLLC